MQKSLQVKDIKQLNNHKDALQENTQNYSLLQVHLQQA
jgi:hypothetical protein